jgi:hypothetical protein
VQLRRSVVKQEREGLADVGGVGEVVVVEDQGHVARTDAELVHQ